MLSIQGCGYRYPGADRWAFRNVSFEVRAGEIVRIAGRNGTGKSTLLKVISGIFPPTEGTITAEPGTRPIYMDQSAEQMLALDLTVREQLSAFFGDHAIESSSPTRRLKEFGLDLELRPNEFVGHLSGGQRQIIALLAIIESGATVLCLDEFLSALDVRSTNAATSIIEQLTSIRQIAIAAVSHTPLPISIDHELVLPVQGAAL